MYPHYVAKAVKKGRTQAEVDTVIEWLLGYSPAQLREHLDAETTILDFLNSATMNPNAHLITGVVCGVRVENIDDPHMRDIRYLDKLIDELAKGKPLEKILRT